ncbi:MAG: cyclodeaminase [Anaerolineae bacterium]|nr:cyclodeaminase [Anaerolineae bacterium]NIN95149.1 cyclodeaminase [Anaerolineae bacterium]NIQ79001.1 cyclodeaminase [Anaerolineae bacterium]
MEVLLVKETDIRRSVSLDEAISAVEAGFTRLAAGEVNLPPVMSLDMPEVKGEVHVKGAYINGSESLAIKVATGFYDNPLLGLPSGTGMMMVFSARTGFPQALLFDNGYLTDVRTAAAGAVAAKYLARKNLEVAGVVGAGAQGRYQMMALGKVRAFQKVLVYDLDKTRLDSYVAEMPEILGVDCVAAEDVESVVRESDILVTCTPSTEPYVRSQWLHPGLHITAMGSDAPYKQELDSSVLARADLIVCDHRGQCAERGELHHGLEDGTIGERQEIVELGDLTSGRHPGRTDEKQITVCDLTGVGVQDAAIATLAYEKAVQGRFGSALEI